MNETTKCLRCGHIWQPRVQKPIRCARCGSFRWDTLSLKKQLESPEPIIIDNPKQEMEKPNQNKKRVSLD